MIGFFLIKRLIRLAVTLAVLGAIAVGVLYVVHAVKKHHLSLPRTILHTLSIATTAHSTTSPARAHERHPHSSGGHAGSGGGSGGGSDARGRCGAIAINQHASCGFAENVMRAYDAHPGSAVIARSPVTHQTYTVHCRPSARTITCVGGTGDDASIAFRGPPVVHRSGTSSTGAVTPAPGTS